jgi:hypothetical protein
MAPFAFSTKLKAKTVPSAAKVFWHYSGQIPETWGKPSVLLIMPRRCTSSALQCTINIWDETSSSCMTVLAPTPLASHRKQLQRWSGKFFHTPIALIWQTAIFLDV